LASSVETEVIRDFDAIYVDFVLRALA